ncbi:NADH-dependent flavin oxidoreductase nadA [Ditylenchus destructor]|uniref:NADH-dependent flavin oxidoreductase nadA n=1 Tax=Ditylenchus destructor TaxID=166010 RepID=A0AAD4N0S5_9BILA|nr:NADH-dependent flavin oxidoreductase nadA [Ditylenchus destructor]
MSRRIPVTSPVSPAILGEKLLFKTSKRTAENRFIKAALTELVSSYIHGNAAETGIPTQGLMNMYQKFSHGGFGVLLTGNLIVDPHHLEMTGNMIIHHSVPTGYATVHHLDNSSPATIHHLRQFITCDNSSPATIHHLDNSSPATIHHLR